MTNTTALEITAGQTLQQDTILYWVQTLLPSVIKIRTEFDFNFSSDPVTLIRSSYLKMK